MTAFRIAMLLFAFANLFFAMVATQVVVIAEVGDYRSRLILAGIHPVSAITTAILIFISKPRALTDFVVSTIILANIFANVILARLIATGVVSGDWIMPLVFSAIPAVALIYASFLLVNVFRTDDTGSSVGEQPSFVNPFDQRGSDAGRILANNGI